MPYLCTGTLGRVPWEEKVRAAAAAGFTRLSIYEREYHDLKRRGWTDHSLVQLLSNHNLLVAEYDGAAMTLETPDGIDETVSVATALGARSITVLETTRWCPADHPAQAASTLAEISDRAAESGLLALLEPFAWSTLNDHRVAAGIIERAGRANAGLLLDTWHLWRGPERGNLEPGIDPAIIKEVQIGDLGPAPAENPTGEDLAYECIHHRLLPGDGHGRIAELLSDLFERGMDAPLAVEVFSDELNKLNPHEAAQQSMTALQKIQPQTPQ